MVDYHFLLIHEKNKEIMLIYGKFRHIHNNIVGFDFLDSISFLSVRIKKNILGSVFPLKKKKKLELT